MYIYISYVSFVNSFKGLTDADGVTAVNNAIGGSGIEVDIGVIIAIKK
jgi:hypothetical protein